jgi:arginine utilization protein RocB
MSRAAAIEVLTKDLIRHQSISDIENPQAVAREAATGQYIKDWLETRGIPCILQSLSDGRNNVYALVRGKTDQTVILAGHFDTVGVGDYPAALHPFEPDTLVEEQEVDPQIYVVGRGSVDMKSGVAVAMVLLDELQHNAEMLNGSVMFVATCDEECNSWGILHTPNILLRANGAIDQDDELSRLVRSLTGDSNLSYLGVINLDYTTERFQGDPDYYVWSGTIGKLLPSILVVGAHYRRN